MTVLVTGAAGFIGSNFVLDWLDASDERVIALDKLTYAGNIANLNSVRGRPEFSFVHLGIEDKPEVRALLESEGVRAVVNFAAESHVDRSIASPDAFIQTNVVGTLNLLEAAKQHWQSLEGEARANFRFLHVSTDEVYGTLEPAAAAFTENHPYMPNSPYAASKAASDHLVRAYGETYGLPVVTTNCSNNYGPRHFPEKLIPLIIHNALAGKPLPIYGDGQQVRDWLYVSDHCAAIRSVLKGGRLGETYNVGGNAEHTNIDVVRTICGALDILRPRADNRPYADQITFVKDRPGHDRRYAIDATKIRSELGWQPSETFESGIAKTIAWYLANEDWVADVTSGAYRQWVAVQYA